jgi:hypothetical protein
MGNLNKLLPRAKNAIKTKAGAGSGVDTSTIQGIEKASKPKPEKPKQTAAPAYAGKSHHNFMQRGPSMSQARMTSKQYGSGRVGLT